MSTSSAVVAGTNATSQQYNDLRTDAITRTRIYAFEVKGALITGDEQGPRYIVREAGTVTAIHHSIKSGTSATFRIQKDTTDIDNGVSASTTVAEDTSPVSAAVAKGQILTLDITGVSGSPENIVVEVEVTYTV